MGPIDADRRGNLLNEKGLRLEEAQLQEKWIKWMMFKRKTD